MAATIRELRMKVCVVGASKVGKSSLIRRFVYNEFDETYYFTIGANISKAVLDVSLPGSENPWQVVLMLWDIMGEKTYMDLLKEAYFKQASGVIAVADLSRPETFVDTNVWIRGVRAVAGDIPVVLLGNKLDLVDFRELDWSPLAAASAQYAAPLLPTSAKEGNNVQVAFSTIARVALTRELKNQTATTPRPPAPAPPPPMD
jgi:Ras-related protein Rab-6A